MININLIAERRVQKIREIRTLGVLRVLLMGIAAVGLVAYLALGMWQAYAIRDLAQTKSRLAEQDHDYNKLLEVRAQITAFQPVVNLLKEADKSERAWMIIMSDLSRITPHEVFLDNLSSSSDGKMMQLRITGVARDEKTVGVFMLALSEQTDWAGTPDPKSVISDSRQDGQKFVHFEITVPVRGLVGGDL